MGTYGLEHGLEDVARLCLSYRLQHGLSRAMITLKPSTLRPLNLRTLNHLDLKNPKVSVLP